MSQGTMRPREAWGAAWGGLPLTASEGTGPAAALTLDFWPPELRDDRFLWLKVQSAVSVAATGLICTKR